MGKLNDSYKYKKEHKLQQNGAQICANIKGYTVESLRYVRWGHSVVGFASIIRNSQKVFMQTSDET